MAMPTSYGSGSTAASVSRPGAVGRSPLASSGLDSLPGAGKDKSQYGTNGCRSTVDVTND